MKLLLPFILCSTIFSMTGLELATLVDSRLKPIDIKSINTMKLIDGEEIKKTYELITKSKDNSKKQMIWFLQPAKNKGTAFLKIEHEEQDDFMTMWLPGFRSDKRIRTSEKSDSFMGSDLSFEDLTNRELLEYEYKIVEENIEDNWYKLESIPLGIDTEYSKHITKITEIEEGVFIAMEEDSFDKKNLLLKTKLFNFEKIGNYYVMNRLEVKNVQENHSTLLTVNEISLDNNFEDSMFIVRNLKKRPN